MICLNDETSPVPSPADDLFAYMDFSTELACASKLCSDARFRSHESCGVFQTSCFIARKAELRKALFER